LPAEPHIFVVPPEQLSKGSFSFGPLFSKKIWQGDLDVRAPRACMQK
jgi:hypothetical protein